MSTIKINCDGCSMSHEVNRDTEAPKDAISMGCNWCPNCEDKATEYYEEWYNGKNDDDDDDRFGDDPNQLMLFSITDEILKKPIEEESLI